jgi:hypothetical protein
LRKLKQDQIVIYDLAAHIENFKVDALARRLRRIRRNTKSFRGAGGLLEGKIVEWRKAAIGSVQVGQRAAPTYAIVVASGCR